MSGIKVSFIIPHKGRELFLQQTLDSIAKQSSSADKEVIVVTQNPALTADTLRFGGLIALQVIYANADLTISALRNVGAQSSKGSHLAFLDADISLSEDWLTKLLPLLEDNKGYALISAMQCANKDAPPLELIRTALSNAHIDTAVNFLPGRNLLLRKDTFTRVGGFPEHLVTCEDYYFTDKVSELGSLWYTGRASYVHLGEDKQLGEMFSKEVWRGQSNLQSVCGRRIKAGEWPSFCVPPWITGFALAGTFTFLVGNAALAMWCLLAALLPFAVYVMRLYFWANRRIALRHIVAFYGYYFPARAWGTILGGFRTLGKGLHDQ